MTNVVYLSDIKFIFMSEIEKANFKLECLKLVAKFSFNEAALINNANKVYEFLTLQPSQ